MADVSLDKFVEETLLSIAEGVAAAQDVSKKRGLIPIALATVGGKDVSQGEQLVSFAVEVEVNSDSTVGASGSVGGSIIKVVSAKADAKIENSSSSLKTHKIEFSVPMYFNSRWPGTDN